MGEPIINSGPFIFKVMDVTITAVQDFWQPNPDISKKMDLTFYSLNDSFWFFLGFFLIFLVLCCLDRRHMQNFGHQVNLFY